MEQPAADKPAGQGTIGERLRAFRARERATLRTIAQSAGVTASFLSDVERNRVMPSITTLRRLCDALNIRIVDALEEGDHVGWSVVRAGSRRKKAAPGEGAHFETLVEAPGRPFDLLLVRLQPGAASAAEERAHNAKECLFIIEGRALMTFDGVEELLFRGDAIYIPGDVAHRTINVGETEAVMIVCVSGEF